MNMCFTTFVILISLLKGAVPENDVDAGLLEQVEDTYGQCLRIVDVVGGLDEALNETRRRGEDVAFNAKSKLMLCTAMVKRAETFNRGYFALTRVLGRSSEISFLTNLLKALGKKMGDTLYVASLDGDSASEFHSLSDGQGPTVVVVETTAGVIFGGYTDVSWRSSGNNVKSTTSFLFQIRPSMMKFSVQDPAYAVYHRSNYGPTFGGGHDLHIASGARSNKASCTNKHSYTMTSTNQLNNNEKSFQVKDYVVIKAVPL